DVFDNMRPENVCVRYNRSRRFQSKTAGEDRQDAQHDALGFGKKLVAPVERRPQRLVAWQCRAATLGEKIETVVEPSSELLHPERRGAGRRQLDGERDAVELPTDRRYGRGGLLVRGEMRVRRLRPRNEQRDRAVPQHVPQRRRTRWHRERWHPVEVL